MPANAGALGGGRGLQSSKAQQAPGVPILGSIPMPTPQQAVNAIAQVLPHLPQQGKMGQLAHVANQLLPHVQQFVANQQQSANLPSQGKANPTKQRQGGIPMANKTNLPVNPAAIMPAPAQAAVPLAPFPANPGATIVPVAPTNCLIPGCTRMAYVDLKSGQSSSYCSTVHRQEAVTQGIANACIMCLKLPQSEEDHFCGKACRDEALSAPS